MGLSFFSASLAADWSASSASFGAPGLHSDGPWVLFAGALLVSDKLRQQYNLGSSELQKRLCERRSCCSSGGSLQSCWRGLTGATEEGRQRRRAMSAAAAAAEGCSMLLLLLFDCWGRDARGSELCRLGLNAVALRTQGARRELDTVCGFIQQLGFGCYRSTSHTENSAPLSLFIRVQLVISHSAHPRRQIRLLRPLEVRLLLLLV